MKDGDIVEQGKHEELLAAKGFYASLYQSQFEGEAEENGKAPLKPAPGKPGMPISGMPGIPPPQFKPEKKGN
jgi:hypothetical protein